MSRTDLEVVRGDTKKYKFDIKDSDGAAIDITGWTLFMTIKRRPEDTDDEALISKTITSHTDAANGETLVTLTHDETKDLAGQYYYDVQVKKGDGSIMTVLNDIITFTEDITTRIS